LTSQKRRTRRNHSFIQTISSLIGRSWKAQKLPEIRWRRRRQSNQLSELPANEEIIDINRSKEMPANEPPSHEMETTENEMAALDRMARMTGSTTLGSGNPCSERPSAS
jgi:hypothetical protein